MMVIHVIECQERKSSREATSREMLMRKGRSSTGRETENIKVVVDSATSLKERSS